MIRSVAEACLYRAFQMRRSSKLPVKTSIGFGWRIFWSPVIFDVYEKEPPNLHKAALPPGRDIPSSPGAPQVRFALAPESA